MFLPKMVKNWMARQRYQEEIDDFICMVNTMAKGFGLPPDLPEVRVLRRDAAMLVGRQGGYEYIIVGLSPYTNVDIEDDGLYIVIRKPESHAMVLQPLTLARWHASRRWPNSLDSTIRQVVAYRDRVAMIGPEGTRYEITIELASESSLQVIDPVGVARIVKEFTHGVDIGDDLLSGEADHIVLTKKPNNDTVEDIDPSYHWDIEVVRTAQAS